MSWVPHVMILYSLGSMAMLFTVRIEDLGRYFFTFIGIIALLFALVAVMAVREQWASPDLASVLLFGYAAALFIFNILVRFPTEKISRGWIALTMLIGASYLVVYLSDPHPKNPLIWTVLHHLTAALVLGTSLVTMILGHWYLVKENLSFDILERSVLIFLGILGLKAILSMAFVVTHLQEVMPPRVDDVTAMLVIVRLLAGLAVNFVLGIMVYRCAKMRSNQSATGIMYVVTFFALIGELTSMYLTMKHFIVV